MSEHAEVDRAARARPVRPLARARRPCPEQAHWGRKRDMEAITKPSAEQVERELGELLDQETFEPPAASTARRT